MKSPEQQLVDLFHKFSVQRFNHTEFARLVAEEDETTQRTFFYAMSAFISYKAGFASAYPYEVSPDTLAGWCIAMRNCMNEYESDIIVRQQTHNELI